MARKIKPDNSWIFNLDSKPKPEKTHNFDLCRLRAYSSQTGKIIVIISRKDTLNKQTVLKP